jgi:glycosyltransferase involved in cell wall biosynthesis
VLVSMLKHDAFVAVGEGRAGDFPVVLRAEGAGITGDCHFQQTARFGSRIKRRCQQAAAVIAPATAIAKELEEAGYDSGRVKIIPNGVPILDELVSRQEARTSLAAIHCDMELAPNAPLVVFTGRLDAGKGLRELIQAWKSIASAIPDARLWLVGEGPLRDELFQRVRDAELVDSVRMPGTFDDVSDILRAATVFVLPSHAEGLSLSLLEAMAHERAVIASSVPGNQQVVTSGENGLLVPPKNPAVLAQVLQEILEQPEQATAYGQAARQHVTQHFSLETMAERHRAAIEASRNA